MSKTKHPDEAEDIDFKAEYYFLREKYKNDIDGLKTAIESVCCDPEGTIICFQNQADNDVLQVALDSMKGSEK